MTFLVGSLVPITAEVRAAPVAPATEGALVNAASTTLTIQLPDGTTATPAMTNASTGRYQLDYLAPQSGIYDWHFASTGPSTAAGGSFEVLPQFLDSIVSLADAKAHVNVVRSATDAELLPILRTATEIIEDLTGEVVVRRTVTETRRLPRPSHLLALWSIPAIALTSVARVDVPTTTWNVADLHLDGPTGVVTVLRGAPLSGHLQIVYTAGRAQMPARYTHAARELIAHLWESQQVPLGGRRRGGFGGAEQETVVVAGRVIPRSVADLLPPRIPGVA